MNNLRKHFTTCNLIPEIKRQKAYLSPKDTEIGFDEARHIYLLPDKKLRFPISVTGFCKAVIHDTDFHPDQIIRNTEVNEDHEHNLDMHAARLVEWKYSSVFGSLFHAIVEYFFTYIVNGCAHDECHTQDYNATAYMDWLIDETNSYNLQQGIQSQCLYPDQRFRTEPIMPCRYAVRDFMPFVDTILERDTFAKFLKNHYRFNINNESYIKNIVNTMEKAFDLQNHHSIPLRRSVQHYRAQFKNEAYEWSIDKVITKLYTIERCIEDLRTHLLSFRQVLLHLPLNDCCDIRPEYVAFDEERGLAGSVDLTMRMRHDPQHLLVYDWKTCKQIFKSYRHHKNETNKLMDYSCQLHTYANLMREINPRFTIDLFIVNITHNDSCIYSVRDFQYCDLCCSKFKNFKREMYDYDD